MRISTKTRYAIRAVYDLAYHGNGQATQARDISRRQDVPLRYLEQIFQKLKRADLVEAKRGPKGGYSLKRSPEAITLGDVVRATRGPIAELLREAPPEDEVVLPPPTRMPMQVWAEIGTKIEACFDQITISDLCRRSEALGLPRGGRSPMYFI